MANPWIEFTLKLFLFGVTYYFILDYIVVCGVPTKLSASITLGMMIIITTLYILFSEKTRSRCDSCGSVYKVPNKYLGWLG